MEAMCLLESACFSLRGVILGAKERRDKKTYRPAYVLY